MPAPRKYTASAARANTSAGNPRYAAPAHGRRPSYGPNPVGHPIGSMDLCWCGEPRRHGWDGKEDGAPHPAS